MQIKNGDCITIYSNGTKIFYSNWLLVDDSQARNNVTLPLLTLGCFKMFQNKFFEVLKHIKTF